MKFRVEYQEGFSDPWFVKCDEWFFCCHTEIQANFLCERLNELAGEKEDDK